VEGKSVPEVADEILTRHFESPNSSWYELPNGVLGTAGSVFAGVSENLWRRIQGDFRYDTEEKTKGVEDELLSMNRLERDAIFTPATAHSHAEKAFDEGRVEDHSYHISRINDAVSNPAAKPLAPYTEENHGPISRLSAQPPQESPAVPNAIPDESVDPPVEKGEPVDLAWDSILKNLNIIQ
jgi:hypothetical protein